MSSAARRCLGAGRRGWGPLLLLAAILVAFLPLSAAGFAGTDSLTLVDTSRFDSWKSLLSLFSSPVMSGTPFVQGELIYRPLVSFTFGLDYALWHLHSVGFFATNLLFHLVTTFALVALLRQLQLSTWAALLGGAAFALHPAMAATIPVIARRDNLVAGACLLGALLALVAAARTPRTLSLGWLLVSLILYFAALLSKETAFGAFPLLACVLAVLWLGSPAPWRDRLAGGARVLAPFLAVIAVALALRYVSLGGLGGHPGATSSRFDVSVYDHNAYEFVRALFWPIQGLVLERRGGWVPLVALCGLLSSAVFWVLPACQRRVFALGVVWVAGIVFFYVALQGFSGAWNAYVGLVGLGIAFAAAADGAAALFRARRFAGKRWLVAAVPMALLLAAFAWTSPLLHRYAALGVAGGISQEYADAVVACENGAPDGARLTPRPLPEMLDLQDGSTDLLEPTLFSPYTVQSVLHLAYPDRSVSVVDAGSVIVRTPTPNVVTSCSGATGDRTLALSY